MIPNTPCHEPPVRVGQTVKDFILETYNATTKQFDQVSFEELRTAGKWLILFFYPADYTFVCPTELADLAVQHKALQDLGAEVISVSTDSIYTHLAWHDSERLLEVVKFQMASDRNGELSRHMGVYDPTTGNALRGAFIINPEGMLVSSEINFYNVGRNCEELLRKFQANTYLRKNTAEATPAKWTPGAKTLTPSEALVGKVGENL